MPAAPEEIELEIPRVRITAKAWGPIDGPRVLACHGWLDNASSWDRLAPLLPELRIVAIDAPGHGRSGHVEPGHLYRFADLIADLSFAADALGWETFSLFGHSMGASAASLLAGTMPARIERTVLIEALGPLVETVEKTPARMAMAIEAEKRRAVPRKRIFQSLDEAAEKIALVTQMQEGSARILVERGMEFTADGWEWSADHRLRLPARQRFTEAQVRAFLSRIDCPVLVVWGEEGFDYDRDVMTAREACIADLTRVSLAGHHHVHLDDPEGVAAPIRELFAR